LAVSVWGWIAGILAGAAIIGLLVVGDDDHSFSGRDREALFAGPPQALISAPAAIGAEQAMTIVVTQGQAPPEVAPTLEEVRQLLATAAGQPTDQAKATLEQAQAKLKTAIDQVEKDADDTSNDVTKIRLLRLALILNRVEDLIQIRLDRL
jgi:GAF domain-containing protein